MTVHALHFINISLFFEFPNSIISIMSVDRTVTRTVRNYMTSPGKRKQRQRLVNPKIPMNSRRRTSVQKHARDAYNPRERSRRKRTTHHRQRSRSRQRGGTHSRPENEYDQRHSVRRSKRKSLRHRNKSLRSSERAGR